MRILNDLNNKKILIVEDEESNFALLKAILRKSSADLVWAHDGAAALEFCRENKYDLILLDIKMPGINGYEVLSTLRSQGNTTPVIAQTAYARLEEEASILKKGFDAYISKPIDSAKLITLIRNFIG